MLIENKQENNNSANRAINLQAEDGAVVTASDVTVFDPSVLYIGTAGNVTIVTPSDTELEFVNIPAGSILPVLVKQVLAATTATDIIRLY